MLLELPHTPNCLVCGRSNPHGLHLSLHVDPATGEVTTTFTPTENHIGFQGIIHGGLLATVIDEAMVWVATWANKHFCVCAEMSVRFKRPAAVNDPITVTARVDTARPKLITTTSEIRRVADGTLLATATGKYTPLTPQHNQAFLATLVPDSATAQTTAALRP